MQLAGDKYVHFWGWVGGGLVLVFVLFWFVCFAGNRRAERQFYIIFFILLLYICLLGLAMEEDVIDHFSLLFFLFFRDGGVD